MASRARAHSNHLFMVAMSDRSESRCRPGIVQWVRYETVVSRPTAKCWTTNDCVDGVRDKVQVVVIDWS